MTGHATCGPRPICIIVAFYQNPQLVDPFFDALFKDQTELRDSNARICIINDSPDDQALSNAFEKALDRLWQVPIDYQINPKNIGYLKSINQALDNSIERKEDVLLINSDALLFPGTLREIVAVAYSDPMIGFVSPRSNNATLCTFPHDSSSQLKNPEDAFVRFQKASSHLPRVTYAPTAVGFCLLIKYSILCEFGTFDEIYKLGYNEENDLIMRANRFGYRAVLANRAYAWHEAEQSFSSLNGGREEREKINAQVLHQRYPEYSLLIEQYFSSPTSIAEKLISALYPVNENKFAIAVDCPQMGAHHNGTMRLIKEVICALDQFWPANCELKIFMSQEAWDFHGLQENSRLHRHDLADHSTAYLAVIRIGQPFFEEDLTRLWKRAPVVGIFMLDTIAWDCGYLKAGWNEAVWAQAFEQADLIYTNSQFTHHQFQARFELGLHTKELSIMHSASLENYKKVSAPSDEGLHKSPLKNTLLIIGNQFHHKDVERTARMLADQCPYAAITVLSQAGDFPDNVQHIATGYLSEAQLSNLYSSTQAIIFPSHYEGFGFPVLHALAHQKPIFLRPLPVYKEIELHLSNGAQNLHYFDSLTDLAKQLNAGIPQWQGEAAKSNHLGWQLTAQLVWESIQERSKEVQFNRLVKRLRTAEANCQSLANRNLESPSHTEHLLQRISGLENQMDLMVNTWSWRLTIGLRQIRKWLGICKRQLLARVK